MSTLLLRISGWFLLFGGLLMAVTNFHLPISPVVAALINLVGGVLLLLGLPALYARQATQVRWIGLVGLIIIWLDTLISLSCKAVSAAWCQLLRLLTFCISSGH